MSNRYVNLWMPRSDRKLPAGERTITAEGVHDTMDEAIDELDAWDIGAGPWARSGHEYVGTVIVTVDVNKYGRLKTCGAEEVDLMDLLEDWRNDRHEERVSVARERRIARDAA